MLTPRMPLYIPCAYVVFMYCGSAAALRMRAGSAAAAAATAGLLGELYYAAYDITGNWNRSGSGSAKWKGISPHVLYIRQYVRTR